MDKGQVLALFVRESGAGLGGHGIRELIQRLDETCGTASHCRQMNVRSLKR
jgi:hypothetical protein